MKKLRFILSARIILIVLSLVMVFHFLVLSSIIPFDIVWGGRLQTREEMLQFEVVSLLINLIAILTVSIKAKFIRVSISNLLINSILWIFAVLFALNTLGNLAALNSLETIIFTPITALLTVLIIRVAIEKI